MEKGQKLLNVQDGIRPYRPEKQLKINNSYMYDYLIDKSTYTFEECSKIWYLIGKLLWFGTVFIV